MRIIAYENKIVKRGNKMFGFKEDFMYNVAYFEENMTVSQLHAVLEKIIESGRGDYRVMIESYCCGTNGVELDDKSKQIDIC